MLDVEAAFGLVIQRHRKKLGWSQQKLAVAVGMSLPAVSQWERGKITPKRDTAMKIDEALEAKGEIVAALGYTEQGNDHEARITQLEAEVRSLAQTIVELQHRAAKDATKRTRRGDQASAAAR